MTEPAPRRHRRRERHRRRDAGTDISPAGAGGTPGEYAGSEAPAPAEEAPAGKDRRRFRRRARDDEDVGAAQPAPAPPVERPPAEGTEAARPKWRPGRRPDLERGLRGIVGAGPSQVGVVGAMRARDAAQPTAEDLAAAEQDLVIVRRHYVPPDADPRPT